MLPPERARSADPVVRGWQRFWFPPVTLGWLAVLRIAVGAYVVADLLAGRRLLHYGAVAQEFYDPILLLRLLHVPRLDEAGLLVVYAVLLVAAVGSTLGLATRVSLPVTAALYLYWYGSYYSYGETSNSRTVIAVALLALAVAPTAHAYTITPRRRADPTTCDVLAGWVFQLLTVLLVYLYLFSAIAKLTVTGPTWWRSGALEWGLVDGGTPAGGWLLTHAPDAVPLLALGGLVFELCAPLLLVPGRTRLAYAAVATVFHLTALLLLDMDFLAMPLVALLCAARPPHPRESGSTTQRVGLYDTPSPALRQTSSGGGETG